MNTETRKRIIKEVNYCFSWDREFAYQYLRDIFKGINQEIALDLWDDIAEYPWFNSSELLDDILA